MNHQDTPIESWREESAGFSHSKDCSGIHVGAYCLVTNDVRGAIVTLTSRMLDNPDTYGIYPTTKFYNDLESYIQKEIAIEKEKAYEEVYDEGYDDGAEKHKTKNGYCCACGYDIAAFEERLATEKQKSYQEGRKQSDMFVEAIHQYNTEGITALSVAKEQGRQEERAKIAEVIEEVKRPTYYGDHYTKDDEIHNAALSTIKERIIGDNKNV